LKILAVLVVGTMLGILATRLTLLRRPPGTITNGPWSTSLTNGSAQSDPYRRAMVAIHGLFALNRSEAIYYSANADSDGHRLDGDCR